MCGLDCLRCRSCTEFQAHTCNIEFVNGPALEKQKIPCVFFSHGTDSHGLSKPLPDTKTEPQVYLKKMNGFLIKFKIAYPYHYDITFNIPKRQPQILLKFAAASYLMGTSVDEVGFIFGIHDFLAAVESEVSGKHVAEGYGKQIVWHAFVAK